MFQYDFILNIILISFRIGGLVLALPIFTGGSIPPSLKYFFVLGFAFCICPYLPQINPLLYRNSVVLFLVILRELGLGLVMGYSAKLIFLLLTFSLEFAGLQMGFSIANLFDPQNNAQTSVLSIIGVNLLILFFLNANFHHEFFLSLIKSYEKVPIALPDYQFEHILTSLSSVLNLLYNFALKMVFPIVFSVLAIQITVAIVARMAPQTNLFFNITFIVNILVGLTLVNLSWPRLFAQVIMLKNYLLERGFLIYG